MFSIGPRNLMAFLFLNTLFIHLYKMLVYTLKDRYNFFLENSENINYYCIIIANLVYEGLKMLGETAHWMLGSI